jgi:hypothetical protein
MSANPATRPSGFDALALVRSLPPARPAAAVVADLRHAVAMAELQCRWADTSRRAQRVIATAELQQRAAQPSTPPTPSTAPAARPSRLTRALDDLAHVRRDLDGGEGQKLALLRLTVALQDVLGGLDRLAPPAPSTPASTASSPRRVPR